MLSLITTKGCQRMGLVHIPSLKRKNNFLSGRYTNIWKAVNSEPKALGRKTELQVTQNTETKKDNERIILRESCKRVIMKELTLGLVFCSAVQKEEKQPGLLTNRFLQLT